MGPEFGSDASKTAVIVRALYGLKSAGAALRNHLIRFMETIQYLSSWANPDLKMRPEI